MKRSEINVIFFGAPPEGYSSFPSSRSREFEALLKPKKDGEIDAFIHNKRNKSKLIYVRHGFSGASNKGEIRGGRPLGIIIEVIDCRIASSNEQVIELIEREFQRFLNHENVSINKNIKFYGFKDIDFTLKHFQKQISKSIKENLSFTPISPGTEGKINLLEEINVASENYQEKQNTIQNISKPKIKDDRSIYSKLEMLNERIETLEKKNKSFLRWLPYIWLTLLSAAFLLSQLDILTLNSKTTKKETQQGKEIVNSKNYSSNKYIEVKKIENGIYQFYLVPESFSEYSENKTINSFDQFQSNVSKYFRTKYENIGIKDNDIKAFIKEKNKNSNKGIQDWLNKNESIDQQNIKALVGDNYLVYQIK